MRTAKIILVGTVAVLSGSGWAVVGCLTEEKELVRRASIIIVGKIEQLETVRLAACPPGPETEPGTEFVSRYEKCGAVTQLTISTKRVLRGSIEPLVLKVLMAGEGFLVLGCDDRPPIEKLAGLEAVLFLEISGGRFWTLDGPNSIYAFSGAVDESSIARLKGIIESARKP